MRTLETHLRIQNESATNIIGTAVWETDNYDWDHNSGPHRNFVNVRINAHSSASRREEVNRSAKNCPFTMSLKFSDGTEDIFRVNQKYAIGKASQDFQHKKKSHNMYCWRDTNGKTLCLSVQNTTAQKEEILAENHRKDADAKLKQKRYEEALKSLNEALRHANQAATKNNIIRDQGNVYSHYGLNLMDEGFDLESKNNSQEAEKKFNDAKAKLQKAESLHHDANYQKNINLINLKIEANKIFNEALKQEKDAYDLFTAARKSGIFNDYTSAQNKYKETAAKYEEALKKFEEGAKTNSKFGDSVKVVKEQIAAVEKVVEDIDKAELNYNINQVNVSEDKKDDEDENQQVNTNLQQQVDG